MLPVQTMSARTAGAWQSGRVGRVATALVVVCVVLVLAGGAWLAVRGRTAVLAAGRAEQSLREAEQSYAGGDLVAGADHVATAADELARARRATGDPVWALAATLPVAGDDVDAVRTVLRGAAGVVGSAVPLARLAAEPRGGARRPRGSGRSSRSSATPGRPPPSQASHEQALLAQADVDRVASGSLHPARGRPRGGGGDAAGRGDRRAGRRLVGRAAAAGARRARGLGAAARRGPDAGGGPQPRRARRARPGRRRARGPPRGPRVLRGLLGPAGRRPGAAPPRGWTPGTRSSATRPAATWPTRPRSPTPATPRRCSPRRTCAVAARRPPGWCSRTSPSCRGCSS